jgi:hypothetical protein
VLTTPAVLNARVKAANRTRRAYINEVEKAKGLLILPALVYERGKSIPPGTAFGEGDYTETNLTACIQTVHSLIDMEVDGEYLVPGNIDTAAYYSNIKPVYASKKEVSE